MFFEGSNCEMNIINDDLDCLTTGVINIDYDLKIVSINSAAESLFGLSKSSLFGVSLQNLVVNKKLFKRIFHEAFSNKFSNKRFHTKWVIPSKSSLELDTICTIVKNSKIFCCFEVREKNHQLVFHNILFLGNDFLFHVN